MDGMSIHALWEMLDPFLASDFLAISMSWTLAAELPAFLDKLYLNLIAQTPLSLDP